MEGPKQKLLRPLSEPEAAVVQLKFMGMQRRGMRISAIRRILQTTSMILSFALKEFMMTQKIG